MPQKKEPAPGERPAGKLDTRNHRILPPDLTRKQFVGSLIGSAITLLVAAADNLGDDSLVDRLLELKDEHNKRRRP